MRRHAPWLVIVVALLLHAPCLTWPWYSDDFTQVLVLEGQVEHPRLGPWSLYDWGGAPGPGEEMYEIGAAPWWMTPDWKVRFFRPLTSASLALDHALFGRAPLGAHAVGLGLFGLLLVLVHALYRAAGLTPRAALIALALVALEDGSVTPVGWPANRNSLLEGLFTVAALLVAVRARDRLGGRAVAGSLCLATLAMGCKESGLAAPLVLAGFFAFECRGGRGTRAARLGVAGGLALAAGFLAFLLLAGYGARSPFYATPWSHPLIWLERLAKTLLGGATSLIAPVPVDLLSFAPGFLVPGLALGALVWIFLGRAVFREVRGLPLAGTFALLALLALLPEAGAFPSDRLLLVPSIGTAPLVAVWLERGLSAGWKRPMPRLVALTALVLSPLVLVQRGFDTARIFGSINDSVLEAEVGDPQLGPRDVLLLQTPSEFTALNPLTLWHFETGDREVRFFPLQMGRRALRWTRVDEHTFELESLEQPFLTSLFEGVFLATDAPPAVGQRWRTALFEVEALAVDAPDGPRERGGGGGLRRIRVHCERSLDEPGLRFLTWRDGRLRHLEAPAVGETLELPAAERLHPLVP